MFLNLGLDPFQGALWIELNRCSGNGAVEESGLATNGHKFGMRWVIEVETNSEFLESGGKIELEDEGQCVQ